MDNITSIVVTLIIVGGLAFMGNNVVSCTRDGNQRYNERFEQCINAGGTWSGGSNTLCTGSKGVAQ